LSRFRNGARASTAVASTVAPAEETARLLGEGKTFEEIAEIRGRQVSSVASLVADLVERGEIEFQSGWIRADHRDKIEEACGRLGTERLKPVKDALPEEARRLLDKLNATQTGNLERRIRQTELSLRPIQETYTLRGKLDRAALQAIVFTRPRRQAQTCGLM